MKFLLSLVAAATLALGCAAPAPTSTPEHVMPHADAIRTDQTVYAFNVSGKSLGDGSPAFVSPWNTWEEAQEASGVYVDQLQAWWSAMYPGDTYVTRSDIIIDTVHLDEDGNPIRFGVLPDVNDNPPLPAAPVNAAVGILWGDGTAWQAPW